MRARAWSCLVPSLVWTLTGCGSTPDTSETSTGGEGIEVMESESGGDGDGDGDGDEDEVRLDMGDGGGTGMEGTGDGDMECSGLPATIRDFQESHPDFQAFWGTDPTTGLVEATLGGDQTPVLVQPPPFPPGGSSPTQISSVESFADWYHDVPGTNQTFHVELPLTETGPGVYTFDDQSFFPIDGMGFPETFPDLEGEPHNYHFTTEIHTEFTYEPGQEFQFTGDDDLWMFVDGQLVIDLGGLHGPTPGTVQMDSLGLTPGESYTMDIFHAERRTEGSTFRVDTNIDCFIAIE